ncbi:hypothetical protein QYF36_007846 [Acer negundo]|nr:hypothetical protein QYF36_007846 [Acer negundo]
MLVLMRTTMTLMRELLLFTTTIQHLSSDPKAHFQIQILRGSSPKKDILKLLRKEMKVGEKLAEQSTFEKLEASKETFMDMDGSKENGDIDFHMDNNGYHVQTVFEGKKEKNNVSTAVHLEKVEGDDNELEKVEGGDDEFSAKVNGDTEIVHAELGDTSVSTVLSKEHEIKEMLSNDVEKADPQSLGLDNLVKQPQSVDEYPFPAANSVVPNPNMSVVELDGPHSDVLYKDIDKTLKVTSSYSLLNSHLPKSGDEFSSPTFEHQISPKEISRSALLWALARVLQPKDSIKLLVVLPALFLYMLVLDLLLVYLSL